MKLLIWCTTSNQVCYRCFHYVTPTCSCTRTIYLLSVYVTCSCVTDRGRCFQMSKAAFQWTSWFRSHRTEIPIVDTNGTYRIAGIFRGTGHHPQKIYPQIIHIRIHVHVFVWVRDSTCSSTVPRENLRNPERSVVPAAIRATNNCVWQTDEVSL